jgi:hypothetical protein
MIRRVIPLLTRGCAPLLLAGALAGLLAGCVSVRAANGVAATIILVPIFLDDDRGRMQSGNTYSDPRWFSDPDSHPAVRPRPAAATPAPAPAPTQ